MNLRSLLLASTLLMPALTHANALPASQPYDGKTLAGQEWTIADDMASLLTVPDDPSGANAQALTEIAPNLDKGAAERAVEAALCAQEDGLRVEKLIVVDMSAPATSKRLWAFDVKDLSRPRLVLNDRVAHGSGSDPDADGKAQRFSNVPNSHMTSLGLYQISERYRGKHGWSRRLDGLFARFNDKARERAVVLHPSNYVKPERVGRSQGCPAVSPETMQALEKAGLSNAVLWIDGPDKALEKAVADCSKKRREALVAQKAAEAKSQRAALWHQAIRALGASPIKPDALSYDLAAAATEFTPGQLQGHEMPAPLIEHRELFAQRSICPTTSLFIRPRCLSEIDMIPLHLTVGS